VTEDDYIRASNVGKLSVALAALTDVLVGDGDEYGVTADERARAYVAVGAVLKKARKRCEPLTEAT
jgi:hypothetical protein